MRGLPAAVRIMGKAIVPSKRVVRSAGRGWALLLAVGLTSMPVAAQLLRVPSSDRETSDTTTSDRSNSEQRDTGSRAAADQIQTTQSQRPYQADQIDTSDRRSDRRQDDRPSSDRTRDRDTTDNPDAVTRRDRMRVAQPSEFETFASQVGDKQIRRFGANLLVPGSRDFIAPPTATVPQDYRINPGDRLVIGLTGSAQADNLRLTVDSDGRIFIPRIGAVRVGGVRYGDLQSAVAAQVSRQYRNFRLSIAVDELHGITVYVTGFALTPGSYTVSSLSTLVNAVLVAGGPSAGGSFRSIQLRRNGRLVADFDLYDFLLKGDKSADSVLQNGDVIFVAPVGAQVAVIGSVNNEAVFESRPGDTVIDLLMYAGGVNTTGDLSRLLALDPLNLQAGWQQLTPAEARGQVARRAQVLRVLSDLGIARPLGRQGALVTLSGEVVRPGRYFLAAGAPLSSVVAQAGGLTSDAYVFGTVFTRESLRQQQRESYDRAVRDVEYLLSAGPLTSALSTDSDVNRLTQLRSLVAQLRERQPDGRLVLDLPPDASALPDGLLLQNNDTLYVPSRPISVGVFGSVPGPSSFQYRSTATIGDYVAQAGGVQKIGDKGQIFVLRANGTVLSPRKGLFAGSVLSQRALPGDLIYVPINPARGEFWRKLGLLTSTLFSGAVSAATVVAVTK